MAKLSVGIADMKISTSPDTIISVGLGSCVGISLYDPRLKLGGLVHVLLPTIKDFSGSNPAQAKFADSGIKELYKKMVAKGASPSRLQAKISGGSNMFPNLKTTSASGIGDRNVEVSRRTLQDLKIPIVASDTGGNYGRTLELDTETGKLNVKTVGRGSKDI